MAPTQILPLSFICGPTSEPRAQRDKHGAQGLPAQRCLFLDSLSISCPLPSVSVPLLSLSILLACPDMWQQPVRMCSPESLRPTTSPTEGMPVFCSSSCLQRDNQRRPQSPLLDLRVQVQPTSCTQGSPGPSLLPQTCVYRHQPLPQDTGVGAASSLSLGCLLTHPGSLSVLHLIGCQACR